MSAVRRWSVASVVGCVAVGLCIMAGGCNPKRPANGASQSADAAQISAPVSEVRAANDRFIGATSALPGRDAREHAALVADALGTIETLLPSLYGPQPDGAFRQQLRIIGESTARLRAMSSRPDDAPPVEPVIGAALRATRNALQTIRSRGYSDDETLARLSDELSQRVGELDTLQGALHQFVVAQAIQSAARVTSRMTEILEQRQDDPSSAAAPQ